MNEPQEEWHVLGQGRAGTDYTGPWGQGELQEDFILYTRAVRGRVLSTGVT